MAAERRAQKQFERLGKLPVDRQPEASNFRCDLEEPQRVADLADMSRTSLRALLNGAAKNTVQSAPQKSSSLETTRKVSISPQPTDSRLSAHHNPAPQPKAAPHAPQKANFKSSQPPENVQQTGLGKTQVPGAVRPTALTPRPALSPQDETSALRGARSIAEATRIHEERLRREGWHVTADGIATRNKPSAGKTSDGK